METAVKYLPEYKSKLDVGDFTVSDKKSINEFIDTDFEVHEHSLPPPEQPSSSSSDSGEAKEWSFSDLNNVGSSENDDKKNILDIHEKDYNDKLNELTDDDLHEFAGLVVETLDWGADKALVNLANRKPIDSPELDAKKERVKIIWGRCFIKWGLKFKMEFLAIILTTSYGLAKWAGSVKIEDDKPQKEKTKEDTGKDKTKEATRPSTVKKTDKKGNDKARDKVMFRPMSQNNINRANEFDVVEDEDEDEEESTVANIDGEEVEIIDEDNPKKEKPKVTPLIFD